MRAGRRTLVVLTLAAVVLGAPAGASAAQTYSDTIRGYEYYATSTEGRFAGSAAGSLPGDWTVVVRHTALCGSCTPTATITGGTFSLATVVNYLPTLVTGRFVGGTVQVTNAGPNCTNQTFVVDGVLGSVGPWSTGNGTGTFTVTLTHYRYRILGSCVTYSASVAGTLSISF